MITSFKGRSGGANSLSFSEGLQVWRMRDLANIPVLCSTGLAVIGLVGNSILNQGQERVPARMDPASEVVKQNIDALKLPKGEIQHTRQQVILATQKPKPIYYQCHPGTRPDCDSNGVPRCYNNIWQRPQIYDTQFASYQGQVKQRISQWTIKRDPRDPRRFLCTNQQKIPTQIAASGRTSSPTTASSR